MIAIRQSALALGALVLSLGPDMGMRDALVRTLLAQLVGVAPTIALSLRLPRGIGGGAAAEVGLVGR